MTSGNSHQGSVSRGGVRRLTALLLSLTLPMALLTVACGSSGGTNVRPIEDALSGSIEIVELTDSGAAVQVTTDVDMMCSVVYGLDDSYGGQTTDPGMGVMSHRQHFAPMRGLEPDTEYHFRVQGTADDGTIYASEDLTFRTLPADDQAADAGANVATAEAGARIVDVSSSFSDAWSGPNAIDDDTSTEWSSTGDGDDAFITVELAGMYDIAGVGLWTRTMGTTAQISRFQVVTGDGSVFGPFDVPDASEMYVFPVSTTAQELRFEVVESSGGNTGVVELAAFAAE